MSAAAIIFAAIYGFVRGVLDLRAKRYIWAFVGIVSGLGLLLLVPVQTHAVRLDLPPASNN